MRESDSVKSATVIMARRRDGPDKICDQCLKQFSRPGRQQRMPGRVDDRPNTVGIVYLPRDHDRHVVGEADQPAIEHPVRGTRQSEAVADDVRSVCLDRADMRRLDFRPASSVDQFQAGNCATFVIGTQDHAAEHPVANDARGQVADPIALLLIGEGGDVLMQNIGAGQFVDTRQGIGVVQHRSDGQ
eukprot:gene43630-59091_t